MMKMVEGKGRRWLCLLLTILMLVQMLPIGSFVAEQVSDSSFQGFTGWTAENCLLDTAAGVSGNGAQITPQDGNAVLESGAVAVTGGEKLRASIFVQLPASGQATLQLQWYSDAAAKKPLDAPAAVAATEISGSFTELAGDITAPQNAKAVRMRLVTGSAGTYLADNASIRAYSDLPEFIGVMGDGYGVEGQWSLFYPLMYAAGDWAEQKNMTQDPYGFNYAQIVAEGNADEGAVRFLRSDVYEHIGIAIGANLELGKEYTIKMWVKGQAAQSYGGLQIYGHGDPVLALFGPEGEYSDPDVWYEVSKTVTATRYHLYIFMSGGGYGCDILMDNVQVLDSQGNDMLKGAGNFTGNGTLTLEVANRLTNGDFELTEYTYLPLAEFNGDFADIQQVTSDLSWSMNAGSQDQLTVSMDDNGKHISVTKADAESVLQGPQLAVNAGKTYQLSLDVKTSAQSAVGGWFYNAAGEMLEFWDPAVAYEGSDWSTVEAFFTAPQGAYFFAPMVLFVGSAGDTLAVDNVKIYTCRDGQAPETTEPETTQPETTPPEPETGLVPITLDTGKKADAYACSYTDEWVPMFPTGAPGGTWPAWSSTNYGEIAAAGHNDPGSLHLISAPGRNTGIAINAGMTPGQKYTLTLWVKGTSNSGRVLNMYANGDTTIIAGNEQLSANWKEYTVTFTATVSQLNMMAVDWGNTDIYIDNITLKDASANDLLAGKGDFCKEGVVEPEAPEAEGSLIPTVLDTGKKTDAYACTYTDEWVPMFPSGVPGGTWPAWSNINYGEIAAAGHDDPGSLHLISAPSRNTGIAINAGMTPGQKYTLTLWVKGTSNSGRVLNMYANGDTTIIAGSEQLSPNWKEYSVTFTATVSQLNMMAVDWGNTDIYIDNITLKNAGGTDLLAGKGDFCQENPNPPTEQPESTEPPTEAPTQPENMDFVVLDTQKTASHGVAYTNCWAKFFPTGTPGSTWPAWDSTHYGEIVEAGYKDAGALHLVSAPMKNAGVSIDVPMTPGKQYTLGMWVKGTSNSGRVLGVYGNGDPVIIGTSEALMAEWTYHEVKITANMTQLTIMAVDWGNTELYIDNITLVDEKGRDLLAYRGDFCKQDTSKPRPDTSVNLLTGGDFENVATLAIPGWTLEGNVTENAGTLTLKPGAQLLSLRYGVEPDQILQAVYTGENGALQIQFGYDNSVIKTLDVATDGALFSVPEKAQWLRVSYQATDKTATVSQIQLLDKGSPANLDFEMKAESGSLPMNWSTWTAVNDPALSYEKYQDAYLVEHQTGSGVEESNALHIQANRDLPENQEKNIITAVVDSIQIVVEPNTTYSFSYWVKMDAQSGCVYPSVRAFRENGSADGSTQWMNGAFVTDTDGQWKQFKTTFTTGANTQKIAFRLEFKGANQGSQCWVDRIEYKVLGSALETNMDFEIGEAGMLPLNWTTYERNFNTNAEGVFGDYAASWEPGVSVDGSAAMKIKKLNGNASEMYLCSTMIKVEPGSAYYFSYDAATKNASNGDQIMMMLRQKKANGDNVSDESKAFYWPTAAYATGLTNWDEFGAIFETTADCEYIQIMFCIRGGAGYTAYIDNVQLTPTKKIEDMNLDFEYSVGKIPLNWSFQNVLSKSSMAVTSENVFSGNQALRVLREDGELDCSFVYSDKRIPVKAGDKIEVVFNMTSRNAVSGQFSACFFGFADATTSDTNKMVNAMYGQERITNAGDQWSQWDTYELVWTVPKGVNYIQLCLRIGGTYNDVLIDDITVYNYTQSDNMIYFENFANPSVTTGLPGGWEKGEITGTGEAKVNGQMSLTGNENSNVEIVTKLYTLKSDYVYSLAANVFTTGTAKGQLIMEAVNWDGSVAGQPVVLDLNTGETNQELKANFESLSAVYYRLILRKTEGNGSVCIEDITIYQTGEPYKGITWAGKWLTHPDETARISYSPHPFTERHYYTRTEINLDKPIESAQMQLTADDKFDLYINGMLVYEETRTGDTWDLPVTVDIAQYLQQGKNVIAIDMFNNIYLYGLLFDGIVKMEDGSALRFYSTSDTMMAAECLSDEMVPTRNPLWTAEDEMSWMQVDYDISSCPLWVHADEFAAIGGGGWGDISFDPTEYSDYKIYSNEFIFPEEAVTAGETVKITGTLFIEKELPEVNSFRVDIWKRNTTSRICSGVLTIAGGKTTADWPIGEEFVAEFELSIPQFLAEGAYTVQLENTVSIVSDYFINNKIGNLKVVQIERPLTTTSSVEVIDGKTQMVINGEVVAPMWYARPERPAQFQEHIVTEFGEVGVNLVVSYVFLNNVYGDVWTPEGFVPDLVDSMMLDTLAGNPDAQLIVAIDLNAPQWWCEENPGEMAALSETTVTKTNASFASKKWREESGAIMLDAIDHMMSQPYANNIVGFKITGGYTLEWNWWATSGIYTDVPDFSQCGIESFRNWLTEKYGTDEALQQAWGDSSVTLETVMPPAKEDRRDDYWDTVVSIQDMPDFMDFEIYMADVKAETIEYFCALANQHLEDRLIVGTYAGYFYMGGGYEFSSAVSNQYYQKILQSENIDFVKTPWMYGMRETGDSAQFMGPVDSVSLNGKLWIVEEDSRLNRKEMAEGQDGRAAVGWTRNYQQSVEQLKRNFSYILAKGMGVSFYNLMWDFFDDDQYYGVIGQMHQEMTLSLGLSSESVADIAVFVDGESQMLIPWDGGYANNTLYQSIYMEQLEELGHIGAPYDMYLTDDLADGTVPEHKINIFIGDTWIDQEERAAIEGLKKNGNILVFIFTSGITDGTRTDIALMEELIEMDMQVISTQRKQIATAKVIDDNHWLTQGINVGRPYGVKGYDLMSPVIAITDSSVTPLAYHSTSSTSDGTPAGQVALAVKEMDDWTSIYSAVPNMPQAMFRNMLEKIGGHIYTEIASDVIYANENYVALHSNFAGERTITLPGNYTVYDVFNREIISTDTDTFSFTLSGKETRLFRLSQPETVYVYAAHNEGGTVSQKGLTTLQPGESMTLTAEPADGFRVTYAFVDGKKQVLEDNTIHFTDIQESHTVIVHFGPDYGQEEPVVTPVEPEPVEEENTWLLPALLGGAGLLILLAIVLLLFKRKKKV